MRENAHASEDMRIPEGLDWDSPSDRVCRQRRVSSSAGTSELGNRSMPGGTVSTVGSDPSLPSGYHGKSLTTYVRCRSMQTRKTRKQWPNADRRVIAQSTRDQRRHFSSLTADRSSGRMCEVDPK